MLSCCVESGNSQTVTAKKQQHKHKSTSIVPGGSPVTQSFDEAVTLHLPHPSPSHQPPPPTTSTNIYILYNGEHVLHQPLDPASLPALHSPGGVRIKEMRPKKGPSSAAAPTSLQPAGGASSKGPAFGPHSGSLGDQETPKPFCCWTLMGSHDHSIIKKKTL